MALIAVSLPEGIERWVEAGLAEGRWSSVGECICELLRRDMEIEEARRRLDAGDRRGARPGRERSRLVQPSGRAPRVDLSPQGLLRPFPLDGGRIRRLGGFAA